MRSAIAHALRNEAREATARLPCDQRPTASRAAWREGHRTTRPARSSNAAVNSAMRCSTLALNHRQVDGWRGLRRLARLAPERHPNPFEHGLAIHVSISLGRVAPILAEALPCRGREVALADPLLKNAEPQEERQTPQPAIVAARHKQRREPTQAGIDARMRSHPGNTRNAACSTRVDPFHLPACTTSLRRSRSDPRDIDFHRADFRAGAAQTRSIGQPRVCSTP